jgi:predicted TIM-barrel fold metal-dependent hydrolase
MSRAIDFRARPNTPEWASYLARRNAAIQTQAGSAFSAYQAPVETLAGFIAQLDAAGIERAVFAARNRQTSEPVWTLTNDFVAECVRAHPTRLAGFAGIDASDPVRAAAEARRSVEQLGLLGICFDPFILPAAPDDPRFDPIYDTCMQLGVPAIVTLGGWPGIAAPLRYSSPLGLDVVAKRFPKLVIIGSHAGWPFVTEMIAVAWRCENVFFENSFYHFAPGAGAIVDAANSMIGDKILYASAYPFSPIRETLDRFRALPFTEAARDKVLYSNADALLARIRADRAAAAGT